MGKSDGTVIHFVSPKVDAEVSSNTFIVSGNYTHNKIEELLPDILPQIGSAHLTQLKDYAEKFEALKPQNDDGDGGDAPALVADGGDDVPMLIDDDLNFEAVAQADEKDASAADASTEVKDEPAADADADASSDADKAEPAKEEAPAAEADQAKTETETASTEKPAEEPKADE